MPVRLRLQRYGAKKRPFYRVVAADKRSPRDGRFIELLGTFDPLQEPPIIRLHKERVDYWLSVGAVPSQTVATLVSKLNKGEAINLSEENADLQAKKNRQEAKKQKLEERRQSALKKHKEAAEAEKNAAAKAAAEEKAKLEAEAESNAETAEGSESVEESSEA